ncbi:MAG: argininosuccinate lyase [Brevinematia bacterium]
MKLWAKNKKEEIIDIVEEFEVGKDYIYDKEIAYFDVIGTIAHVKMLNKIGIISDEETKKVLAELEYLKDKFQKEPPNLTVKDEDIHTYIENFLVSKVGDIGKKIHTGRSRNDQVLTAMRLYEKSKVIEIIDKVDILLKKLLNLSKKFESEGKPLIGYTHFRQAMPISASLWIDSFIEALEDDRNFLKKVLEFIDKNPLGTAAGFGVPLNIDRKFTTKLLEFSDMIKNPVYAQNSRGKFESMLIFALGVLLGDISRFSNDVIVFSSDEFGFVKLSDRITTGSSIMPHKKNPDIFELIRSKAKKVMGYAFTISNITFSLNSGYNKDLQETKELVIEGIRETLKILEVMIEAVDYIDIDSEKVFSKMSKKIFSVDITFKIMEDFKLPFRDAYRLVGEVFDELEMNTIDELKEKFKDDSIRISILDAISKDVRDLYKEAMGKRL